MAETEEQPGRLWEAVLAYFTTADWPVRPDPDAGLLETAFKGRQGRWTCVAGIHAMDTLVFYSLGPMDAGPDMVGPLNELLTRANYGLIIGNFEVDLDDGSFRFKTSIDATEVMPSHEVIHRLALANVLTMDRYLPGVQRLLYAGVSVEQALAEVEG